MVWLGWKSEVVRRIFPISKGECYIDLRRAEHSLLSLSSLPDPGTTSASSRRAGVPMGVIAPDHSMEEEGRSNDEAQRDQSNNNWIELLFLLEPLQGDTRE